MKPEEVRINDIFKVMNLDSEEKRASFTSYGVKEIIEEPKSNLTLITISSESKKGDED